MYLYQKKYSQGMLNFAVLVRSQKKFPNIFQQITLSSSVGCMKDVCIYIFI